MMNDIKMFFSLLMLCTSCIYTANGGPVRELQKETSSHVSVESKHSANMTPLGVTDLNSTVVPYSTQNRSNVTSGSVNNGSSISNGSSIRNDSSVQEVHKNCVWWQRKKELPDHRIECANRTKCQAGTGIPSEEEIHKMDPFADWLCTLCRSGMFQNQFGYYHCSNCTQSKESCPVGNIWAQNCTAEHDGYCMPGGCQPGQYYNVEVDECRNCSPCCLVYGYRPPVRINHTPIPECLAMKEKMGLEDNLCRVESPLDALPCSVKQKTLGPAATPQPENGPPTSDTEKVYIAIGVGTGAFVIIIALSVVAYKMYVCVKKKRRNQADERDDGDNLLENENQNEDHIVHVPARPPTLNHENLQHSDANNDQDASGSPGDASNSSNDANLNIEIADTCKSSGAAADGGDKAEPYSDSLNPPVDNNANQEGARDGRVVVGPNSGSLGNITNNDQADQCLSEHDKDAKEQQNKQVECDDSRGEQGHDARVPLPVQESSPETGAKVLSTEGKSTLLVESQGSSAPVQETDGIEGSKMTGRHCDFSPDDIQRGGRQSVEGQLHPECDQNTGVDEDSLDLEPNNEQEEDEETSRKQL